MRETFEEMGIMIELEDNAPIITQRIFTTEGISFLSFTYTASWLGDDSEIKPKVGEISDYAWFEPSEALASVVSGFDVAALRHL